MNKPILIVGLVLFVLAILFPPFEYVSHMSAAFSSMYGGNASTDIAFQFIGSDQYVYSGGEMVGSEARIASDIWMGILAGILVLTLGIAYLVGPRSEA